MAEKTAEKKKNDWVLKLLALVFAVILWFYADAEQNPITNKQFDIPVQYINQAEEYVISDGVPTVRVTVRGKGTDLSSLRSDDFTATVDLSGAMPGDNEYDIVIEAPECTGTIQLSANQNKTGGGSDADQTGSGTCSDNRNAADRV